MTNGWIDIKNTDMMLIMGGNPAENHPCGFKWPVEAKKTRNAKMIVVDPRFTRTAAVAALVVKEGFRLPEDGLFSGFDAGGQTYDKETWNYEEGGNVGPRAESTGAASSAEGKTSSEPTGEQQRAGQEPAQSFEKQSPQVASKPSTPPDTGQSAAGGVMSSQTG